MNDRLDELRQQYGCGPVQFSGADEALYNRHLLFDGVVYRYNEDAEPALEGIDLEIVPGQVLGVAGPRAPARAR